MQRNIYNQLLRWKNKKTRKPLILNGARQVGKTYILREFGQKEYPEAVAAHRSGYRQRGCYMHTDIQGAYKLH